MKVNKFYILYIYNKNIWLIKIEISSVSKFVYIKHGFLKQQTCLLKKKYSLFYYVSILKCFILT